MRLDTRAFAIAGGGVLSASVLLITLLLAAAPGEIPTPVAVARVLFGYSISVAGAFVGALWGYVYGFLLGGAFAFSYNLAAAPRSE